MRREGETLQLATEGVVVVDGRERIRIQRHRRTVFLEREQFAVMKDRRGVGGAAAHAPDARIVAAWIAIGAEQRFTRGGLRLVALRAHEAALVVDVSVPETEHADVALAVERDV